MYRDDPLDDEAELRDLVGDDAVDELDAARAGLPGDPVEAAVDALRVLQGWLPEPDIGRWFASSQRRLGDVSPLVALRQGAFDDVLDAARAAAAAHG